MFGTTLYLYSRPHLQALPEQKRLALGLTGSALFSLGSVLLWAILRNSLPKDQSLIVNVLGLAGGAAFVKLTTEYFDYLDSTIAKK